MYITLDSIYRNETKLFIAGNVSKCAQLRSIRRVQDKSGEYKYQTSFECPLDINVTEGGNIIITSVNGIYGRSFEDFVLNWLKYEERGNAFAKVRGVGLVIMDDTVSDDDDEIENYYNAALYRRTLPMSFGQIVEYLEAQRQIKEGDSEVKYHRIYSPKGELGFESLIKAIKDGVFDDATVMCAALTYEGDVCSHCKYEVVRVEKPIIWDEAIKRGDVIEYKGVMISKYNSMTLSAMPIWVESHGNYYKINTMN